MYAKSFWGEDFSYVSGMAEGTPSLAVTGWAGSLIVNFYRKVWELK